MINEGDKKIPEMISYSGRSLDKNQYIRDCKRGDMYACNALLYYTQTFPKYTKLWGGVADFKSDNEFDITQIAKGLHYELEHTKSPYIAKELVKDHLSKNPKFYDYYEEMLNKMSIRGFY